MTLRMLLLAVVASVLPASACSKEPSDGAITPPIVDECEPDRVGVVERVEIGPEADAFAPWNDGDVTRLELGTQGLRMLLLRLRATGSDVPACLPQRTEVRVADEDVLIGVFDAPIVMEGTAAARVSKTFFTVIYNPVLKRGARISVTTIAGGTVATRNLFLEVVLDGGLDDAATDGSGFD